MDVRKLFFLLLFSAISILVLTYGFLYWYSPSYYNYSIQKTLKALDFYENNISKSPTNSCS